MKLFRLLRSHLSSIGSLLVIAVFVSINLVMPWQVLAEMTWDDVNSVVKNRAYYRRQCGSGSGSATPTQGVATGKLYMIGDSITQGANSVLNTTFTTRGFNPVIIDGLASRSLTPGGGPLNGLGVLEASKDKFKDAGVVVIALGTNGGATDSTIQNAIDIVKGANANAKIFWVNVGADNSKRSGGPLPADQWNQVIQANAGKGYTVVDWAAQVKAHPEYIDPIPGTGLGVHLVGGGNQAFADTISNTVTGSSSPTTWNNLNNYPSLTVTNANLQTNKNPLARLKNKLIDMVSPSVSAQASGTTPATPGQETMVLKDKIAQMFIVRVNTKADAEKAARANVGGVYVREGGEMLNGDAIREMEGKFKTPPIISTDGEGGQVDALGKAGLATPLPSAKVMGTKTDEEITKLATDYSEKMKALGLTMDFAPVIDLDNPSNPIIGAIQRGFSGDPAAVTAKAQAFAKGLEANGIIPVYKHFPGHGNASGDSHVQAVTTPPLDQMKTMDLKPYETIAPSAKAVMMGHLNVPGLGDPNLPASINPEAIKLLRTDYKFNGVVMTDDLTGMKAITDLGLTQEQAVEKAVLAGEDILLTNASINLEAVLAYLETQSSTNPELARRIDESSTRVLSLKSGLITPQNTVQDCSCGGGAVTGASTLQGSEAAEQIFNFFATKYPGKPWIGAGFMGNMQAESGLNPRALEPGTTGDAPIRGRGYGLVQWTFEDRQKPLEQQATAKNVPVSDMKLQLEYVIWELENKYRGILDELQAIPEGPDAVEKATKIIEDKYEVHAGGPQPKRVADAKAFFLKYGSNAVTASASGSTTSSCGSSSSGQAVGDFALPLDKKWYTQHPEWFSAPHHQYPASDIPIAEGTPVYSMTAGKITGAPNGGGYGNGVTIDAGNGITIIYGHGIDGGAVDGAKVGDTVKPGQLIMNSGNTGKSSGPHLHLEIRIGGKAYCPQNLFKGIAEGNIPDPKSLPTSGCTY